MVQGTSSHVGKSVLATALCRIFAQDGLRVAPFKAQNMSLNSYATPDGAEIGRSQAVQAAAALTSPSVDMNPVLIKPEGGTRSQVVLMGQPLAAASPREYHEMKPAVWDVVTSALARLRADYDVVVIEGAGSPAEINLKQHDIVNMRMALHAQAPVLLVGDIDRGGVFAQLVGTMVLLEPEERALVKGHVINKFRGDPSLLGTGLDFLRERTGVPVAGVIPHFTGIHIAEEDSLGLDPKRRNRGEAAVDVAVIRLPHVANFDDFDPLHHEPAAGVRYVGRADDLGDPDLGRHPRQQDDRRRPGLAARTNGLTERILALRRSGVPVIGICAGYQMLGDTLLDPDGVESPRAETRGLGLLPHLHHLHGTQVDAPGESASGRESRPITRLPGRGSHRVRDTHGRHVPRGPAAPVRRGVPLWPAREPARRRDGRRGPHSRHVPPRPLPQPRRPPVDSGVRRAAKGRRPAAAGDDVEPSAEYDKLAALVREHLDMELVYRVTGLAP